MSVSNDTNAEIYRLIIDLQEKLKQSEAERTRLEEMYKVLIKTFKEEQENRMKNLESRYYSFLEDCARRSSRNEKILRSVERVESGANVLYAKTERLKLLRNHYEAYLERVIPTWKQPLRIVSGQLPYPQDEWTKRSQVVTDDIPDPIYLTRMGRYHSAGINMPSEYYQNRYPEYKPAKQHARSRTVFDKNPWPQSSKDAELKTRLLDRGDYDPDYNFMDLRTNPPLREHYDDDVNEDDLDYTLRRKLDLKNNIHEDDVPHGFGLPTGMPRNRNDVEIARHEDRPVITQKPVEIKKPEFIVGRLQPEATSKFECLNREPEKPAVVSPPFEGEKVGSREEAAVLETPEAKLTLLKHKKTIDKLKETLSLEEEKGVQLETPPVAPVEEAEVLSSDVQGDVNGVSPHGFVPDVVITGDMQEMTDQKTDQSEEVFEDNEESYPESYYEQPPQPDYSRNLVSNVILEEDETEANANEEEIVENPVVAPTAVNEGYEQPFEDKNEYNVYPEDGTEAAKEGVQTEYGEYNNNNDESNYEQQGEYVYENQDVNNYGQEYSNPEAAYQESQQFYEGQQEEGYNPEGGQLEYNQEYQNANYEQYVAPDNMAYTQQYAQESEYYNQQGYGDGYYQDQMQQNGEYQQAVDYGAAAVEPVQTEVYQEGGGLPTDNLPLRQSNLAQLLESDSESFQIEHGSAVANEDSDFDFSMSQQQ